MSKSTIGWVMRWVVGGCLAATMGMAWVVEAAVADETAAGALAPVSAPHAATRADPNASRGMST